MSKVVLRKSSRGTQFFAHMRVGDCSTAPETEAHLRLKQMVVEAARRNGWCAETEVAGSTPAGEPWKADVLARRGRGKVAIEIQWSAQTDEETMRRQERYAESGVRCLWLLKQSKLPVDRALPAVQIIGSPQEGFVAVVPTGGRGQCLPANDFLDAVFSRRFRFGIPLGCVATVSVQAGSMDCWSCGAETEIITAVDVMLGPNDYRFTVDQMGTYPDLFEIVRGHFPDNPSFGAIKRRYSKTLGSAYLSNGCIHCDALIGAFYEHDAWENQQTIGEFNLQVDERWRVALGEDDYEGWGVYSFGTQMSEQIRPEP